MIFAKLRDGIVNEMLSDGMKFRKLDKLIFISMLHYSTKATFK